MREPTVQDALRTGFQHHQNGNLKQAERFYVLAMDNQPNNPDALHLLGLLMHQLSRNGEAVDFLRRAIKADGSVPDFHNNLGNVLRILGRLDEAVAEHQAAIALKEDYAEAYGNLASDFHDQKKLPEAIAAYQSALRLQADIPELHNNLGSAFQESGELEPAIAAFREAIRLRPNYSEAHNNLANALHHADRLDESAQAYTVAIRLAPDFVEARLQLATIQHVQGKLDEAVKTLYKLIEINANYYPAHNNLSNLFRDLGRYDDAVKAGQIAIQLRPQAPEPYLNLGSAQFAKGEIDEAIASFKTALHLAPDSPQIHSSLANALREAGELDESLAEYRKAIELKPDFAEAQDNLLFGIHFSPDYDSAGLLDAHRTWGREYAELLGSAIEPPANDRNPDRRLRIGYVSPDFRRHPVGRMLLGPFASHNRQNFEIIAYSDVRAQDAMTHELRKSCDAWHETAGLSDGKLADLIRSHQIDILVDLSLHLPGSRLLAFARKPAPVQISYLAYPSTTGLSTIDYRLTDPRLDPSATNESAYTEKSLSIPNYYCYRPPIDAPAVGPLPALESNFITFGSLNNFAKISAPTLAAWADLLAAVPNSHLLLHAPAGKPTARVRDFFTSRNIAADRLEFVPKQPFAAYLQTYARIDIGLDPFPFNGGTITCDALWMGVPVVTLSGQTAVGRVGASILSSAGLPQFIARDRGQYVQLASDLAKDIQKLSALRANLRAQLTPSPLCDSASFAANLENACRAVWREWCQHT